MAKVANLAVCPVPRAGQTSRLRCRCQLAEEHRLSKRLLERVEQALVVVLVTACIGQHFVHYLKRNGRGKFGVY